MESMFLGQIVLFGGNVAPRGWALCDGRLMPIDQNEALYTLLGTTFGGDGETNFKLPDLRSHVKPWPDPAPSRPKVPNYIIAVEGTYPSKA